ncbi:hypothetical protein L6258_00655, partial [Candidatus Parcubacteria bacterium]|nr:hypothetical protein [Candidatus Parcubacteria bacterium]
KRRGEKEGMGLWIFLAAAFFILSLGPALHIGGKWQWAIGNFTLMIPLPFILVHKIPLIGGTQEPTRMNPFVMLPLAILAANGLMILQKQSQSLKKKFQILNSKFQTIFPVLCSLFIVFTLIEFLPLPFPTTDLQVPAIYHEIAKDPGDFSVLTLPLGFNSGNIQLGPSPIGSLQFVQTVHQKPSFRATVARLPASAFDYYRDLPLIKYFLDPSNPPDADDTNPELVQQVFKDQLHIKYIVIHHDKYKKLPIGETQKLIENVLQAEKIYEARAPDGANETPITAYQLH